MVHYLYTMPNQILLFSRNHITNHQGGTCPSSFYNGVPVLPHIRSKYYKDQNIYILHPCKQLSKSWWANFICNCKFSFLNYQHTFRDENQATLETRAFLISSLYNWAHHATRCLKLNSSLIRRCYTLSWTSMIHAVSILITAAVNIPYFCCFSQLFTVKMPSKQNFFLNSKLCQLNKIKRL